jgi:hypothetical protein
MLKEEDETRISMFVSSLFPSFNRVTVLECSTSQTPMATTCLTVNSLRPADSTVDVVYISRGSSIPSASLLTNLPLGVLGNSFNYALVYFVQKLLNP